MSLLTLLDSLRLDLESPWRWVFPWLFFHAELRSILCFFLNPAIRHPWKWLQQIILPPAGAYLYNWATHHIGFTNSPFTNSESLQFVLTSFLSFVYLVFFFSKQSDWVKISCKFWIWDWKFVEPCGEQLIISYIFELNQFMEVLTSLFKTSLINCTTLKKYNNEQSLSFLFQS